MNSRTRPEQKIWKDKNKSERGRETFIVEVGFEEVEEKTEFSSVKQHVKKKDLLRKVHGAEAPQSF